LTRTFVGPPARRWCDRLSRSGDHPAESLRSRVTQPSRRPTLSDETRSATTASERAPAKKRGESGRGPGAWIPGG
jgi:hypothetical protein